jgi:hypothetical protein
MGGIASLLREKHRRATNSCDVIPAELREEPGGLLRYCSVAVTRCLNAVMPGRHDGEHEGTECQRDPAAIQYLQKVRREEGEIDCQQVTCDGGCLAEGPTPPIAHYMLEQRRR